MRDVQVVEREAVPGLTGAYVRAVSGTVLAPVRGLVPGLNRRRDELPARELRVAGVLAGREHVLAYDRVCGFPLSDELPGTYVHLLTFPLAMALMTDAAFPFGVMGLVHVENRIEHRRPVRVGEPLDLRVWAQGLRAHDRGRQFDVVGEASAGGEVVWRGVSTYLRRERPGPDEEGAKRRDTSAARRTDGEDAGAGGAKGHDGGECRPLREAQPEPRAEWRIPGDIGRRYGAVSGDRNPIHLHALTARLFGMPRPIAHGMWLEARCLAALAGTLPAAYAIDVRFKLPLFVPATVAFAEWPEGDTRAIAVHDARTGKPHLTGTVAPR